LTVATSGIGVGEGGMGVSVGIGKGVIEAIDSVGGSGVGEISDVQATNTPKKIAGIRIRQINLIRNRISI
jgi:hypothetical protein